jgi:hypothetical protein
MSLFPPASLLFFFIGLVLLGWGIIAYFRQRAWIAQSTPMVGIVVELLRLRAQGDYLVKRDEGGIEIEPKYRYRPVIRFKTHSGRTIDFIPAVSMRPAPYQVGEPVEVIFNPDEPNQAQINRFWYVWFNVFILIFFGLFTIGMGLLGIIFR